MPAALYIQYGIPDEFLADADRIGYNVDMYLHCDWEGQVEGVTRYAADRGMTVYRDGRLIWGTDLNTGDEYLLASATDPGDDPLNLWAQAFQRIDYIYNANIPLWVGRL